MSEMPRGPSVSPLEPLGDTPKDGDFVRYLERLNAHHPNLATIEADSLTASGSNAANWRLPSLPTAGASGAAARPTLPAPAGQRTPLRPTNTNDPSRAPQPSGTAWGPAGANTHVATPVGTMSTANQGPPDLTALLEPLLGRMGREPGRVMVGIGLAWFVLGALLNVEPFASGIGLAILLTIAGFIVHSRRRPPED